MINDTTFESLESQVRSYCRNFPAVFRKASGCHMEDETGRRFIDFLAGAGTLNYGHNNPKIRQAVVSYLQQDGVLHSLDLYTVAKREFLETFEEVILAARGLRYRVQFPGPTGTNAIEAAMKIARNVTGRSTIAAFTNGFHGVTLGALAASGNAAKRAAAGVSLEHVVRLPFDGYHGDGADTITMIETLLEDPGSGVDLPAAFLVETVQGEGGLQVASNDWLRRLSGLASRHGVLMIVDDIQAGCGRTGRFFSFEEAGIAPDIVCLSKSIGGIGLPMAVVLIRPQLDLWRPGEHNGTFRGHNLAFVAATAALDFWRDDDLGAAVRAKSAYVMERLGALVRDQLGGRGEVRGRGLIAGIAFDQAELATETSALAFQRGLIVETCGSRDQVLKLLPPLTIDVETLREGLDILEAALVDAIDLTFGGETTVGAATAA